MKLVVAEKPSVAQSLAAVLGAKEKKDGYLEGGGWLVSWCVGHLVELAQPEAYGEQYAKWRYADLPILPAHWKYDVAKDKKKQLGVLHRLMEDKRVDAVVCATDAGREGELIFRLVYQQVGCSKPILRLWISSMEDAAIRDGFEHLRPGADYDLLYRAALCRAGADWLVGINATRLFSVLYGDTLNVGRVMTPTLALIVQRVFTPLFPNTSTRVTLAFLFREKCPFGSFTIWLWVNDRQAMFQTDDVTEPLHRQAGQEEIPPLSRSIQRCGVIDDVVMDMSTIYVCSNNKSVIAFGESHRQLMPNLIGFRRGDFTWLKGLTNLICNHITLLLSASDMLILSL